MAMTYTQLVAPKGTAGSILNWMNYSLAPAADLVTDAQAFIYSQLRVREMRATTTLALAQGDALKALPTDFLDPIALADQDGNEIVPIDEANWLINARSLDGTDAVTLTRGTPSRYAIIDEAFKFDMAADGAMTLPLAFYKTPAELSGGNNTNFLTRRYPHLLRSACLMWGAWFRKDFDDYESRKTMTVALIESANAESDLSRRGSV